MGKKERSVGRAKKTYGKLLRKRQVVLDWLRSKGVEPGRTEYEELRAAYELCGQPVNFKTVTVSSAHARYGAVMNWAGLVLTPDLSGRPRRVMQTPGSRLKFYESYEWRKLRYQILLRDGGKCQACGRGKVDGAVLNVDHIKPLKTYWDLRLEPSNLQTLCGSCNHGKGNWDQTDWR